MVSQHPNSHVILGGDFSVYLLRNWSNTRLLNDYCRQNGVFPVFRHEHSTIDYTHHFNMKYFNNIDHFIVSEQLYQASILKQFVLHNVDNISDHDPLCIHVALDVAHIGFCQRGTRPSPSWVKATDMHIAAYKETLRTWLKDTVLPYSAILCKDVCCTDIEHIDSINVYASQISAACLSSANDTIPFPRCRGTRGCIPGWTIHRSSEK